MFENYCRKVRAIVKIDKIEQKRLFSPEKEKSSKKEESNSYWGERFESKIFFLFVNLRYRPLIFLETFVNPKYEVRRRIVLVEILVSYRVPLLRIFFILSYFFPLKKST